MIRDVKGQPAQAERLLPQALKVADRRVYTDPGGVPHFGGSSIASQKDPALNFNWIIGIVRIAFIKINSLQKIFFNRLYE